MERTTAASEVRAVPPPSGDAAAGQLPAVPVAVGQRLQATIVAQDASQIWFGHRGAIIAARTDVALQVGCTYDFLVAGTAPEIELTLVQPAAAPAAAMANAIELPSGADVFAALARFLAAAGRRTRTAPAALAEALGRWAAGEPTAAALATVDRLLGHEHEARVLRRLVAAPGDPATAAVLRESAKARALVALAEGTAATVPERGDERATASGLVVALTAVERDNAARSALGLPLWVPLPACELAGLGDARMFVRDGDGTPAGATGEPAFQVVLLLDLTQLGELRVDVTLRGEAVDATFTAVRPATTARLGAVLDELRALLADAGLQPAGLQVRTAPGQALPRADLVLPPRDGSALVDLHA